jgi:malonyl-CoA/methylmalonyl-CoA synthetase
LAPRGLLLVFLRLLRFFALVLSFGHVALQWNDDTRVHLLHLFDLSLKLREDAVALEWDGAAFTFGDLERRSNRMADALRAHGFAKGDRLCVQLSNRVELIDLYLACVKLGVIFVPINVLYREREVAHIVDDAGPRAMITGENVGSLRGSSETRPVVDLDGSTPAAIVYTSGTTGASKGAVLTHDNFAANAVNLVSCWQISDRDRFFLALPLFHIHALGNGLHTWLLSGCRMRLVERFDHRTVAAELRDFAPTLFFGVPTMYVRLLETPSEDARAIGASMRLFVSGSAPLPAHVLEQFRDLFGHTILERYGMTETFMNASNPYVGERRAGTVGFPLPGVSIRIEDGELLVRGPNVFPGYWRRDEATANAFTADGFFRTGDLASRDSDGYLTLLGRRSDVIISGGFNIYPREIEELLLEQPGVSEAAVAGVEDAVRGEVPVAYLVGEFDESTLERVCREQLASFKVPRRFVKVESIPRTALGKVQKHLLKLLLIVLFLTAPAFAKPLVVHVTVALCDNATQGIVPRVERRRLAG